MKEITPYLYSILYKKRIQTFSNYRQIFDKWTIGYQGEKSEPDIVPVLIVKTPTPPICPVDNICDRDHDRDDAPIQYEIEEEMGSMPAQPAQPAQPIKPSSRRFIPKKPDSLFWSIFVGQYGNDEFFTIHSKYKNRELDEKTKMIEFLKSASTPTLKPILKTLRITIGDLKEIMGDIMIQKKTNLMSIYAFVLYYKRSIWIMHEGTRSYFAINYPDADVDELPILIYKEFGGAGVSATTAARYTVELNPTKNQVENILGEYVAIDKYNKAMKGMSTYKTKELEEIANKMKRGGNSAVANLDLNKKKQELYISLYRILQETWEIP